MHIVGRRFVCPHLRRRVLSYAICCSKTILQEELAADCLTERADGLRIALNTVVGFVSSRLGKQGTTSEGDRVEGGPRYDTAVPFDTLAGNSAGSRRDLDLEARVPQLVTGDRQSAAARTSSSTEASPSVSEIFLHRVTPRISSSDETVSRVTGLTRQNAAARTSSSTDASPPVSEIFRQDPPLSAATENLQPGSPGVELLLQLAKDVLEETRGTDRVPRSGSRPDLLSRPALTVGRCRVTEAAHDTHDATGASTVQSVVARGPNVRQDHTSGGFSRDVVDDSREAPPFTHAGVPESESESESLRDSTDLHGNFDPFANERCRTVKEVGDIFETTLTALADAFVKGAAPPDSRVETVHRRESIFAEDAVSLGSGADGRGESTASGGSPRYAGSEPEPHNLGTDNTARYQIPDRSLGGGMNGPRPGALIRADLLAALEALQLSSGPQRDLSGNLTVASHRERELTRANSEGGAVGRTSTSIFSTPDDVSGLVLPSLRMFSPCVSVASVFSYPDSESGDYARYQTNEFLHEALREASRNLRERDKEVSRLRDIVWEARLAKRRENERRLQSPPVGGTQESPVTALVSGGTTHAQSVDSEAIRDAGSDEMVDAVGSVHPGVVEGAGGPDGSRRRDPGAREFRGNRRRGTTNRGDVDMAHHLPHAGVALGAQHDSEDGPEGPQGADAAAENQLPAARRLFWQYLDSADIYSARGRLCMVLTIVLFLGFCSIFVFWRSPLEFPSDRPVSCDRPDSYYGSSHADAGCDATVPHHEDSAKRANTGSWQVAEEMVWQLCCGVTDCPLIILFLTGIFCLPITLSGGWSSWGER